MHPSPPDNSALSATSDSQNAIELNSARLLLRRFEESDCDRIESLLNDKEIASNTQSIAYPYPQGEAQRWIAKHRDFYRNGDAYHLAIQLKSNEHLIGAIGLEVNKEDHNAELGYWLGREYWNQGFVTEAARRMVEFGFETLGLYRITSHHLTRNPASGRVMEKIGMTKEGTRRGHVRKWGVFEDVELYGMLASDLRQ